MLNRECFRMTGEGDDVVALVESQLGEKPSGWAIGPEHRKFHELVPFDTRPAGGTGYIDKDDDLAGSVTSAAPASSSDQTAVVHGYVNLGRVGAAAVRVASLVVDRPRTDLAFWAYLAAEIGFGASSLAYASSASRSHAPSAAAASYVL